MNIKISASNSVLFLNIEEALSKFDNDFINKFKTAEYVMDGFDDIQLVSESYFNEKIKLPKGFLIEEVKNSVYSEYEKDSEGNIKESQKYQITIQGVFKNQIYKLIYLNLSKINIKICFD
ncbi:hypothetical protein DZC34_21800 [Clostridium botulinum]|nr:hypothetical protein DZC34_21800 [Clostridium botulinum]